MHTKNVNKHYYLIVYEFYIFKNLNSKKRKESRLDHPSIISFYFIVLFSISKYFNLFQCSYGTYELVGKGW